MKLGILGWPARHSRSPRMHAAAFAALGLDGWSYEAIEVEPAALGDAIARLRGADWRGANVTIPHKEAALGHLDHIDATAARIGAVNTIVTDQGRLTGYNTDAPGFLDAAGSVEGRVAGILGAGGAARAIVHALRAGGAREVRVISRRQLGLPGAFALPWEAASLRGVELLVGCVPPTVEPPLLTEMTPGARVIDLVYGRATPLLDAAARAGFATEDGTEMLVRQGARAFELWTGRPAPIDIMRRAAATS
jgi:shikimate dehydrogenase